MFTFARLEGVLHITLLRFFVAFFGQLFELPDIMIQVLEMI